MSARPTIIKVKHANVAHKSISLEEIENILGPSPIGRGLPEISELTGIGSLLPEIFHGFG